MLQWASTGCLGNSGHTSRTRSHSVTTRSKCERAKRRRCLVGRPEMSMPRSAMTRTALGWSTFGWLPALRASTVWPDMSSSSASAICERALLPVQRNRTRGARPTGRVPVPVAERLEPQTRMQGGAGGAQQPAAPRRGRRGSSVSRPSAELRRAATNPAVRSSRRWYETRFCGLPDRSVSSLTRRSLRASSCRSCQRIGSATQLQELDRRGVGKGIDHGVDNISVQIDVLPVEALGRRESGP